MLAMPQIRISACDAGIPELANLFSPGRYAIFPTAEMQLNDKCDHPAIETVAITMVI